MNTETAPKSNTIESIHLSDLDAADFEILKRLDRFPVASVSGITALLIEKNGKSIQSYISSGFLSVQPITLEESLRFLSVARLKEESKVRGLKRTGSKDNLARRLAETIPQQEAEKWMLYGNQRYVLSEEIKPIVDKHFADKKQQTAETFMKALSLASSGNYNEAHRLVAMLNAAEPVTSATSLGFEWKGRVKSGLSSIDLAAARSLMNYPIAPDLITNEESSLIKCYSLISSWSGKGANRLLYESNVNTNEAIKGIKMHEWIRYASAILSSYRTLESHKASSGTLADRFRVLVPLDSKTCNNCGRRDLVEVPYANFEIGKTAPPFHLGCRCTVVNIVEGFSCENIKRRAQHPVTGASYFVPGNMNWRKWRLSLNETKNCK